MNIINKHRVAQRPERPSITSWKVGAFESTPDDFILSLSAYGTEARPEALVDKLMMRGSVMVAR